MSSPKLKYFQALKTEQFHHDIKAMQYELHYYEFGASDDYWLKVSKECFMNSWAISDAMKNIFGDKYYEDTDPNERNTGLLRQWCELFYKVKELKEKAA